MTDAPPAAAPAHVTTHRLRFNDTDQLGHVNNAVFAVMLEQGRAEMIYQLGLPIGQDNQAVVIARVELDFVTELTWPGSVRIETEVARLGTRSFHLRQRLIGEAGLAARATSVLVVMDKTTRRAVPIDPWRDRLTQYLVAAPENLG